MSGGCSGRVRMFRPKMSGPRRARGKFVRQPDGLDLAGGHQLRARGQGATWQASCPGSITRERATWAGPRLSANERQTQTEGRVAIS
jgi:hypothetical protein